MITRFFLFFVLLFSSSLRIFSENQINQNELVGSEFKEDIGEKAINEKTEINKTEAIQNEESQLELLDQIESEVFYLESDNLESNIVTKQEIERRGFDGNTYTVKKIEDQILADQFSKILKANITNDDINRNLKRNGMTDKDISELADKWGYLNKDEFFEDLKKIYRANAAMNYEVESRLIASQGDISEYYDKHVDEFTEEAKYLVETAFIPYPQDYEIEEDKDKEINEQNKKLNKEIMKEELENYVKSKILKPDYVNWDLPVEINHSEITQDNEFLIDLAIGCMYMQEAESGFILYRMKNKTPQRIVPLENVKEFIILNLRKDKQPFIIDEITNKLRAQALIIRPPETIPVPCDLNH